MFGASTLSTTDFALAFTCEKQSQGPAAKGRWGGGRFLITR